MSRAVSVDEFARLFPAVLAASRAGDALATNILRRAGAELAKLVSRVIEQLWAEKEPAVRVAGTGGVLINSAEVRSALRESLRELKTNAQFDEREVRPLEGALFLARTAANQQKTRDSSFRSE
jgi:N-acetylglucosamine kinase-like BadF-type ATPase